MSYHHECICPTAIWSGACYSDSDHVCVCNRYRNQLTYCKSKLNHDCICVLVNPQLCKSVYYHHCTCNTKWYKSSCKHVTHHIKSS